MRTLLLRRPCGPEVMTRSAWGRVGHPLPGAGIISHSPGCRSPASLIVGEPSPPGVRASRSAPDKARVRPKTDMQSLAEMVTSIDVRGVACERAPAGERPGLAR